MASCTPLTSKEIAIASGLAALTAYLIKQLTKPPKLPLPPGPKSQPIVGHLFSMPRSSEPMVYEKMSKELDSDVIALTVLGQTIVVLNSAAAAAELMDKKSSIYSGRPHIPALCDKDLMDWGGSIGFLSGERWKRGRRMLHDSLNRGIMPHYHPDQEKRVQIFLSRLLDTSPTFETIMDEWNFAVGSGLIYATYGYTAESPDDKWLRDSQKATEQVAHAAQPATFIVNFIPALKYLPEWLPGMGWKRLIRKWREHKEYITSAPYVWTKEQMRTGRAVPSIVQKILSTFPDNTPNADVDLDIELLASTMFGGGTDTTVASGMYFILAIVRHPEVARKIQAELDSVLGHAERLPRVDDRKHMPYVWNTVQELLRWQPASPLAVPHTATEDDYYRGYHIPKGSIVMGNTWAIARDTSIYPDPDTFNPDRFLDPQVPPAPAFGYGRRICPGSDFAEANLFLFISSLMYAFDIKCATDRHGKDIIPEMIVDLSPTIVSKPASFKFRMKLRSEAHRNLVIHNANGL
ncbi:cytochrome P450 [Ceratobasidium sp. AG-I]|nr:cytochrome P450 [Ceratobasidium sp. AG-I]